MRKEVSNIGAGRWRGRRSTCKGGTIRKRVSSKGWLKCLLGSRGKPSKAEALSDKSRPVRAGGARWLLGNA